MLQYSGWSEWRTTYKTVVVQNLLDIDLVVSTEEGSCQRLHSDLSSTTQSSHSLGIFHQQQHVLCTSQLTNFWFCLTVKFLLVTTGKAGSHEALPLDIYNSEKDARLEQVVFVNVNVNAQYLSTRKSCNKVTTAAPWGLSSVDYRTVLVSATMTLRKMEVHSNMWGLRLRRQVNHNMWQFLYAESKDRFELLPVDDGELWQLTVVDTVTTDMMGPARVNICRRAGRVCIRYVDRPVASEDRYEWSLKSKCDRTCTTKLTTLGLRGDLTCEHLTSNSSKFIWVPNCTLVVNLVKFPEVVCKILC